MSDEQHTHTNITHTPGWPAGKVNNAFLFPPVSRCDDCGVTVEPATNLEDGSVSWVTVS